MLTRIEGALFIILFRNLRLEMCIGIWIHKTQQKVVQTLGFHFGVGVSDKLMG